MFRHSFLVCIEGLGLGKGDWSNSKDEDGSDNSYLRDVLDIAQLEAGEDK